MDFICPKSGRDFNSAEILRDCLKSCEKSGICRYKQGTKTKSMTSDEKWTKLIQATSPGIRLASKFYYGDARCPKCGSNAFYNKPGTNAARCGNCETVFEIPEKISDTNKKPTG